MGPTVAFDTAQRRAHAKAGIPAAEQGQDVAGQTALARHGSQNRGGRLLGLARALVTEMPHTLAALETGRLKRRATLLVKEAACLSPEDRCVQSTRNAPRTPPAPTGDQRTRGQLMADALVERATGTPGGVAAVEIQTLHRPRNRRPRRDGLPRTAKARTTSHHRTPHPRQPHLLLHRAPTPPGPASSSNSPQNGWPAPPEGDAGVQMCSRAMEAKSSVHS